MPRPVVAVRAATALLAATAAAAALVVLPAEAATAADSATGWVRIAHLSPDTKQVDVRLAPLDGGGKVLDLDDVAYGTVSHYWSLPTGDYAVAMRPAGSPASSAPIITASVDVAAGSASTVAVFGRNAHLDTKVVHDDLTAPADGTARVRVVQASTASTPVTVAGSGSDGTTIARAATTATVTPYAAVDAGAWHLVLTAGARRSVDSVPVTQGQVVSLFVLDEAGGGLTVRPVVDSSGAGSTPKGFLATGGGFLARQAETRDRIAGTAGAAAGGAALLAAAVVLVRRRRSARA